jgi:sugar phosphate isomerase/epimerase
VKIGLVITTPPREMGGFKELFDSVQSLGYEGIGFRSLTQLSETLETGELEDARQYAAELGLFLDFGLGWLNPLNALTKPEIWALGEGDYCRALQRQLAAAARMGCREIVGEIAGVKGPYNGRYAFDRFRTDIAWSEQLRASENLLLKITPTLDDCGIRIDLENHEDLTTHELLRLVEKIGPQHLGFSLDTANLVVLGEAPLAGARRLAPYVHLAHIKDIFLMRTDKGFLRQIRPAGEGVIDWEQILPWLYGYDPNIHLLVEDHKGLIQIDCFDSGWREHYPELDGSEIQSLLELAEQSRIRVECGQIEAPDLYEAVPYHDQRAERVTNSLNYLKKLREKFGLLDIDKI